MQRLEKQSSCYGYGCCWLGKAAASTSCYKFCGNVFRYEAVAVAIVVVAFVVVVVVAVVNRMFVKRVMRPTAAAIALRQAAAPLPLPRQTANVSEALQMYLCRLLHVYA